MTDEINDDKILYFDPGSVNCSYCRVNIKTLKIDMWGLFSIKDSTNEGSCTKLANQLDALKLTDDVNAIVAIENQPGINKKTITISGQLQMYFVLEKMNERGKGITKITGYPAGKKINYYEPREGDEPMPTERLNALKVKHYRTKQTVIEHCRRILIHNDESQKWIDFFENSKKKDDLADSYVSALSYIKTHKLK